ncbi:carbohydrate sulfotransferase 11-like [Oratosquilla oratoria]|uniref:carbohydrate sulfotransferase 11-like n=1 Tax=Oratosquilla oratoria TaxID=337810 RepID=UPI003F7587A6
MKHNIHLYLYLTGAACTTLLLTIALFPYHDFIYPPSLNLSLLRTNIMKNEVYENLDEPEKAEAPSSVDEWMKHIERRFEDRKAVLTDGCSRVKDILKENVQATMNSRLFSAPKYNLIVCLNAKVGASTWKSNLLCIAGTPRFEKVHTNVAGNLASKKLFTEEKLYSLMKKGTSEVKVFVVRHPLHRLVSAFRDKYRNGSSVRLKKLKRGFFGPMIKQHNLQVDSHGNISVTFPQFLEYVVQSHQSNFMVNRHWRGYVINCSPCTFNYTYIMTTETWDEDMSYLVNKLNISEVEATNHLHNKSALPQGGRVDYFSYYRNIDPHLIGQIYEIYKVDFALFNYTLPDFIEKAIEEA